MATPSAPPAGYPGPAPTPTPGPVPFPDPAPAPSGEDLAASTNIQGNVLAAFNKDNQAFLLVALPGDQTAARSWLGELAPRLSTTAEVAAFNATFSAARRQGGGDPEDLFALWVNISFTSAGIALLDPGALADLNGRTDLDPGTQDWIAGAAAVAISGDSAQSAPTGWLFGGPGTPVIHAIIGIAADKPVDLETELAFQRSIAARHGVTIVFEQDAATLPGAARGHEHFGFKDGISQPGVRGFDTPAAAPQDDEVAGKPGTDLVDVDQFVLGYASTIGAPKRNVPRWTFDGSFLVFRRLAQDVPGFWAGVETQFESIPAASRTCPNGIPGPDSLAARLVGRWRSGTPTAISASADDPVGRTPAKINDFDYAEDLPGDLTPQFAHIRKVYPRSGASEANIDEAAANTRRILRRGIPFGQPFSPADGRGEGVDAERGLVFLCYQSSLRDQFLFLQQAWINSADFPSAAAGKDAVIGEATTVSLAVTGQAQQTLSFAAFVQTEGTVFAITPSIATVQSLGAGQPLPFS